jgi:hypothetical protein
MRRIFHHSCAAPFARVFASFFKKKRCSYSLRWRDMIRLPITPTATPIASHMAK